MAEETNIPNDGVDKLSQLSSFNDPARIGVDPYEPITPPVFDINKMPMSKATVSNPALNIKDNTKGSAPYHPKPVSSSSKNENWGKALMDEAFAKMNARQDNKVYGKIYAYDASPQGAHKARYKAYGQEIYDRVGFSPEINNETWFNENTTMYDDWKRMATQAAWPMMKLGFMSPVKSYAKLFGNADIGQDLAEARDYEEYNAIGYSTKGGIGGFAINLQNSAAYSVGILAEGAVEGALIGGAVGFAEGGVGAIPGGMLGGITGGFKSLLKLPGSLLSMSKNLGKMTMNLKKLQNLSQVKSAFSNAGRAMGNFINPISNTTEAAMKYVFKNPDDLSNLARTARTAGAMWHDVKNMNLALSEGRLEGGFAEQRTYDKLYNNYYSKYGVAPDDQLQKQMRDQAKVAGFQSTWKNTLLVHYSNNIAFPSVTRAGFMKGLPTFSKTMGKVGPYQIIYNPAKKVAGEVAYTAEKVSLKNAAKALVKPATYGKTALNYFKANLVEGLQETAQDVIADATENYYVNSFQNKDRQNFDYSMATLNAAMKKQISKQGLETFASGFAMGSILSIPGGVKDFLSVGYNKYLKNRGNYDQYIQERENAVNEIVDALNTMDAGAKNFFDPRFSNYTTQMLVGKVADDPSETSTKEAKDASFAGFQSAVLTSLRTGTFDMFMEHFEGYKQASPEDIEAAWRLEPGQGEKALQFIDKAVGNAKVLSGRWQYAKDKFKNLVKVEEFAENTPEREVAEIYNEAYLTGLNNLIFTGAAFDNNAERLSSIYNKLSSLPTIQNSRVSNIASITDPERLEREIAMLRTEVETAKEAATTPEAKKQYNKQKELLEKLEGYQVSQNAATIDFLKRIITKQVELLNTNPNLSKADAQKQAVDAVVEEYKKENFDPIEDYKKSFKSVLDTLAGSEENIVNLDRELDDAGGLDNLFEMLMDTHILRNENKNLNKFVNLLNDPAEFYEHVQRNFEWMQKLYNNRQSYYDDVVNNSINNIQRNTLLEALADEGIYVDLEEFANWVEDKSQLPTYFIDQVNNRIIPEGSFLYDKYIEKFIDADNLETKNPAKKKTTADENLQKAIDKFNEQRAEELDKVLNEYNRGLKDLIGFTQEEIDNRRNEAIFDQETEGEDTDEKVKLVEKSIKQLESNNPIEVIAVLEVAQDQGFITPQEYAIQSEDIFSNEDGFQKLVELSEKYGDVENDVALDAATIATILKPVLEKKLNTLQTLDQPTTFEDIPSYEDTKPYADYNKSVDEINKRYDDYIAKTTSVFNQERKKAQDASRPEEMKKAIQEVEDLFKGSEDIVQTKRNYIVDGELHERMSNRIKTGYDTYGYSGEQQLNEVYDKTIGKAFEENEPLEQSVIDNFIAELKDADLPGVNTNKYTVDIVKDELETLVAPKGTRLSKKVQKNISNLERQLTDVNSKLSDEKNKTRLDSLNRQKVQLEQAIENEKTGAYDEPFDLTPENVRNFVLNTVKENAFEESRDAGNIIDPMLKDYLDTETSVMPEFDPEKMSREAYDSLFNENTGYLSQLKKLSDNGDIYIFTKNLTVHANNLVDENGNELPPVAGEIDMIIVDKNGNKYIVDLKTGKASKWRNYTTVGQPSYKKQLENTLQQTGYANLAKIMSGQDYGIKIFPVEVEFDNKGFIVNAGAPSATVVFAGEEVIGDVEMEPYTVTLDSNNVIEVKNEETGEPETISIKEFMQKLIPVKGFNKAQAQRQAKKTNVPENERGFVDSFIARLNDAEVVKSMDEVMEFFEELDKAKPTLSKKSYDLLTNVLNNKVSFLFSGTEELDIKMEKIYIFTQPVKKYNIPEGYRVEILSVDPENQTVEVSKLGIGKSKPITMSVDELLSNALTEDEINEGPKKPEVHTPDAEENTHLKESIDVADSLRNNSPKLAELEQSIIDLSIEELDNNLLKDLIC
jgi:hypothetical protein